MLKKELLLWNYEVKGISNFNQIVEEFIEYSFAEYAFNKSHAAAYAIIGYQTEIGRAHV